MTETQRTHWRPKPWEELTFTDDFMFHAVMKDEGICRRIVELILGIQIERVEFLTAQHSIALDPVAKEIRLDVFLKGSGRVINVEMQTSRRTGLPQRARYYQSAADVDTTEPGTAYSEMCDNYVIFICTFDPFLRGLPVYTFRNTCLEAEDRFPLDDGTKKIFLNTTAETGNLDLELKAFYDYIRTKETTSVLTEDVDSRVSRVRRDIEQRRLYMTTATRLMEQRQEGYAEGVAYGMEQGFADGEYQARLDTARAFLSMGIPANKVAQGTGLTLEEVNSLTK